MPRLWLIPGMTKISGVLVWTPHLSSPNPHHPILHTSYPVTRPDSSARWHLKWHLPVVGTTKTFCGLSMPSLPFTVDVDTHREHIRSAKTRGSAAAGAFPNSLGKNVSPRTHCRLSWGLVSLWKTKFTLFIRVPGIPPVFVHYSEWKS